MQGQEGGDRESQRAAWKENHGRQGSPSQGVLVLPMCKYGSSQIYTGFFFLDSKSEDEALGGKENGAIELQ